MELDDPLGHGQAQPRALGTDDEAAPLLERVEDAVLVGMGDADAGVRHRDHQVTRLQPGGHGHRAAVVGELHRVAEEVEQDLAEPQLVSANRRQVIGELEGQGDAVLCRPLPNQRQGVLEGDRRVEGRQVQLHLAGLDLGEVEDVVEQREEVPAGVANVAEVVLLTVVEVAEHALQQDLGEADDRVQRGAQLVRHAREELGLVLTGDRQLAALAGQLLVQSRVGEGDGRLAGEGGEQVAHLLAERPGSAPADHEGADDVVVAAEWYGDQGSPAIGMEDLEVCVAVDGSEVRDLEGRLRRGAPAHPGLVGVNTGTPQLVEDGVTRAVGGPHPEQPSLPVVLHERAAVGLGQLHGVAHDGREDFFDVQRWTRRPCPPLRALRAGRPFARAPPIGARALSSAGRSGRPGPPGWRRFPTPRRSGRRTARPRFARPRGRRPRRRRSASGRP